MTPKAQKPKKEKSQVDIYAQELRDTIDAGSADATALFWATTAERREKMEIPADRLKKMDAAVMAALNPA